MKQRGNFLLVSLVFVISFLLLFFSLSFITLVSSVSFVSAGELRVTEEHPFLIEGEWISASELEVGDELTLLNGSKVVIKSISDVQEEVLVYNIEAGKFHNFIVCGEDDCLNNPLGVVVHNSNKPWYMQGFAEDPRAGYIRLGSTTPSVDDFRNALVMKPNPEYIDANGVNAYQNQIIFQTYWPEYVHRISPKKGSFYKELDRAGSFLEHLSIRQGDPLKASFIKIGRNGLHKNLLATSQTPIAFDSYYKELTQKIITSSGGQSFGYNYNILGQKYSYSVVVSPETSSATIYHLRRAGGSTEETIIKYLGQLWDKVLSKNLPINQRLDALVEFEYFFGTSNPVVRGGNSIGDSFSSVLQRELGIRIRPNYENWDHEILTRSLSQYKEFRIPQFERAKVLGSSGRKIPKLTIGVLGGGAIMGIGGLMYLNTGTEISSTIIYEQDQNCNDFPVCP